MQRKIPFPSNVFFLNGRVIIDVNSRENKNGNAPDDTFDNRNSNPSPTLHFRSTLPARN